MGLDVTISAKMKVLSFNDQIKFARLYKNKLESAMNGNEEDAKVLLGVLDDWEAQSGNRI